MILSRTIAMAAIVAVTFGLPQSPSPALAAEEAPPSKKMLTVERIYGTPSITGSGPSEIRWLGNSRGVSFLEEQGEDEAEQTHLMVTEVPSGKRRTLCVIDTITVPSDLAEGEDDTFSVGSYQWAETGEFIVFSFGGDVFTLDAEDARVNRRTESDVDEANVTISPDGRMLGFTRHHDMWTLDLETGEETQLTTTGSDSLLNGVLDWVYMEELFTRGNVQGYWWAPDSRAVAYLETDESPVEAFALVDFGPLYNTAEMQYYPKAGTAIPTVRVGVYDFESGETVWMDADTGDDAYIARLYWLGDSRHVAIERINRNQDDLELLFADAATGEAREVIRETEATWVNITYMKHYYETKDLFVWNSERDGHSHLYLYKNDGNLVRQLTSGAWEVTSLDGVDEKRGHIYFTGLQTSLLERHIYRVGEKGGKIRQLSKRPGTHSATFSPDNRYYIDRFSNVTTPSVISVHDATGKKLIALHEADTTELSEYGLSVPEFFQFTSKNGHEFQCSMIKPHDFDPALKYPVLVYTYGGPHAQVVRNRWGGTLYLWHAYMASRGFIVFSLDNRGSFGRGTEWENPILKSLGHRELEDQLAGADYLKTLPYVDGSRIGIWGWSYGGYMTAMAMFKAPGAFKAGAAVAPGTDWRFYDTIYTERYMKQPEENEDGYHDASPINFVDGLQGAFFLAHGMADDNVHVQNSIALVDALIGAGKDFDLMLYPGKYHSIRGQETRTHLFNRMTRFFDENL